jgi:hypothetical protein
MPGDNERLLAEFGNDFPEVSTPGDSSIPDDIADEILENISLGLDGLIHYVGDLEDLVRWFALLYRREWWDAEGEFHEEIGDPIWTLYDERGHHLPAAEKLQETWNRVMHPEGKEEEPDATTPG